MDILVVAATEGEILPFLQRHTGVDHLVTGVGLPACTYQLQKKIYAKKYDFVIQAGIAGAFASSTGMGECVAVYKDTFADIGVRENNGFSSLFDLGYAAQNEAPFLDGWIVNDHPYLRDSPLQKVSAITVNTVMGDAALNEQNQAVYNADIESMEGAALHYVCSLEQVPYLQIRSISNRVGDRDKSRWHITEAVQQLDLALIQQLRLVKQ